MYKRPTTKTAKRLAWFASDSGRRFSLGCVVTLGVGTYAFNFLPHTFLLDTYRELFQMYRNSIPARVTPRIKKDFNATLDDLKVPDHIRKLIKPFIVNSFDVFHAGTTHLTSGAVVGLPTSFNYEDINDIDVTTLLVQDKHINWNTHDAQNLLSSLVISENARKFVIAREIVRCQTIEPLLNSVYPIPCLGMAYIFARKMNTLLDGFTSTLSARLLLYSLICLFSLGNWFFLKDYTAVQYDIDCDQQVSNLGKDYVKGGQEFYEKLLQRNVALRNLLGTSGERLYSAMGNEEFFVRQKGQPILHRKWYFDKLLEKPENNLETLEK